MEFNDTKRSIFAPNWNTKRTMKEISWENESEFKSRSGDLSIEVPKSKKKKWVEMGEIREEK